MKSRAYCFTLNNYENKDIIHLSNQEKLKYTYIIFGKEIGTSGTPHLQGYIRFKSQKTFLSLKESMGDRYHLEPARTTKEAILYCKKEGDYTEIGEPPQQGKRKICEIVLEDIQNKKSIRDIVKENPSQLYRIKDLQRAQELFFEKRTERPHVIWCYGPTGCGKSYFARNYKPELSRYKKAPGTGQWFDGYRQQDIAILDEFRAIDMPYNVLLSLLDEGEHRVQIKGSSLEFNSPIIIITTPYHPDIIYHNEEDNTQLIRRISEIKEFTTPYIPEHSS